MRLLGKVCIKDREPNIAETLLKFKIVQLEGKMAIYESLINEILKLDSMQKSVSDVRSRLSRVKNAWVVYEAGVKSE